MGQFSWIYSDTRKQLIDNKRADTYLLVPPKFQDKYGKYIYEECYDGYGRFGRYDVYDLLAEWNREYLNESMLRKPRRGQWRDEDEEYYLNAVTRYNNTVKVLEKYKSGASDEEMSKFCEEVGYGWGEWKRSIGIDIGCYDEQNAALPYPIKITTKPMDYNSVAPSISDPNQGWGY